MANQPVPKYKSFMALNRVRVEDTSSGYYLDFSILDYAQCVDAHSYKDYAVVSLYSNTMTSVMTTWGAIGKYMGSKKFVNKEGAMFVLAEKVKGGGYKRVDLNLSASRLSIKVKMDKILSDYGSTDIVQEMRRKIAEWCNSASTPPPAILSPEVIKRRMTHMKEYLAIIDYDDVLKEKIQKITGLPTAKERAEAFSSEGFEDFDGPCFDGWKALHVLWANGNSAARAMLATVGRSSTSAYGFANHMRITGTLPMGGYKEVMEAASKVSDKMPWEA